LRLVIHFDFALILYTRQIKNAALLEGEAFFIPVMEGKLCPNGLGNGLRGLIYLEA
jgi:hypothetical protein